jgi:hypothetical protein
MTDPKLKFGGAIINLSRFIRLQARMRRERLRFGWTPSIEAPSTYNALLAAYDMCACRRLPLRVSSLNCDPVIYDSPATNQAFRYWHDTSHIMFGLSFETDDELELADHHLEAVRAEGYGPDTIEHQLLHADTFGQAYFQMCTGRFVGNQVLFDTNCVLLGVEEAVSQEIAALQENDVVTRTDHDGEHDPDRDHDHALDRDFERDLDHDHAVKP